MEEGVEEGVIKKMTRIRRAFNIQTDDVTLHNLWKAGVQNPIVWTCAFIKVGFSTCDKTLQLLTGRFNSICRKWLQTNRRQKHQLNRPLSPSTASAECAPSALVIYTRSSHVHSRNTKSHTCLRGPGRKTKTVWSPVRITLNSDRLA